MKVEPDRIARGFSPLEALLDEGDLVVQTVRDADIRVDSAIADNTRMEAAILEAVPELAVERLDRPWDDGARTNYEAKYVEEGRPILRLEGVLDYDPRRPFPLHPDAREALLAAPAPTARAD